MASCFEVVFDSRVKFFTDRFLIVSIPSTSSDVGATLKKHIWDNADGIAEDPRRYTITTCCGYWYSDGGSTIWKFINSSNTKESYPNPSPWQRGVQPRRIISKIRESVSAKRNPNTGAADSFSPAGAGVELAATRHHHRAYAMMHTCHGCKKWCRKVCRMAWHRLYPRPPRSAVPPRVNNRIVPRLPAFAAADRRFYSTTG